MTTEAQGAQLARAGHAPPVQRADGSPIRVLVVDDEPSLAELLASVLRYEGWEIRTAGDGVTAVRTAREFRPDAVVLDIMLPDFDGLEVLRRVRAELPHVCVLFLTARDAVEDRVAGLDAGADDYLAKPFSFAELYARLRALTRRGARERPATLTVGDLVLDPAAHLVCRDARPVDLSPKEFALLELFMRHPGEVLTRTQMLEHVWDFAYDGRSNVVDVYVRYLREKVDRPFGVTSIETVRGAGYRLRADGGVR
jgi:two-component system OmpR family response regulator